MIIFIILAILILLYLLYRLYIKGRYFPGNKPRSGRVPRIELSFEEAAENGEVSDEALAIHYAPEVFAAVNTMISAGGKGDFVTAVNFDGDWACDNSWDGLRKHPLKAVVYWNVHRTKTHWFIGYNFYHPRDDAEFAFDRHENDLEGIIICAPISKTGFTKPIAMYTEGHGGVPVFFDEPLRVREGSHRDGGLLLDGDRPVIYITPNGILRNCGHNIESAKDHTTYAYVGNNGIHYYHGGVAEQPSTYKGFYTKNPCSYELRSTDEFFSRRNGPFGDGCTFGSYGAFRGKRYGGQDRANPPWNWQSKNPYGIPGSFLTDPVWVMKTSIIGLEELSEEYVSNPWADWKISLRCVDRSDVTLALFKDGAKVSRTPLVFDIRSGGDLYFFGQSRKVYWAAGPKETQWEIKAFDAAGDAVDCKIDWTAEYLRE